MNRLTTAPQRRPLARRTPFGRWVRELPDHTSAYARFWVEFNKPSRPAMSGRGMLKLVSEWAIAACYSADDDG